MNGSDSFECSAIQVWLLNMHIVTWPTISNRPADVLKNKLKPIKMAKIIAIHNNDCFDVNKGENKEKHHMH